MTSNEEAIAAAEEARDAAEDARRVAEDAAEEIRERGVTDAQVARGVEAAIDQQKLRDAAAQLEKEGWSVASVEHGRIVLQGATINWWVHGILPFFTVFLSLIWTAKVAKKTGTIELTLDHLGRVQHRKI